MNIFFLHIDPKTCVKLYVDRHVVKMILEYIQLLSSTHHILNLENPKKNTYIPRMKLTHKNHPCSIWTRKSLSNYLYLTKLTKELCLEYTFRYGKIHKCEADLENLSNNLPNIPDIGFTLPATAMPKIYSCNVENIDDVIESYRQYIFFEKCHIHAWKKRSIPEFIIEYKKIFE